MVEENVEMIGLYNVYVSTLKYCQLFQIAWNGNDLFNESKEKISPKEGKSKKAGRTGCCRSEREPPKPAESSHETKGRFSVEKRGCFSLVFQCF